MSDELKSQANAALMRLHERLAPLQRVRDHIESMVEEGFETYREAGSEFNWGIPGTKVPSIPDLLSHAESFLQSAKIAIAATTEVLGPFYGVNFDHRFNRIVAWASEKFGSSDPFTENARHCEVFVKQLLRLRDAVEHPSSGRFFVTNIRIAEHEGKWLFGRPGWGIEGESHTDMLADMDTIIERIVEICEILVIEVFFKFKGDFPMHIEETPPESRDPQCPIRYRVIPTFAPSDIESRDP